MNDYILILISFFLFISLIIVLYNYFTQPILKLNEYSDNDVKISVLIPARNEENNITDCLNSILNQTYKADEIIVMDDQSTDNTISIVEEFQLKHSEIKVYKNENLPEKWLGKNWACYNLFLKSKNEYLLFVDADVRLDKNAIESLIQLIKKYKPGLISIFPTQQMFTLGEKLVVPLMNWLLLSFLPLRKVFETRNKSFVAANGQFMLFERNSYIKIGTHKSVSNKVVEDMELCRLIKNNNLNAITLLGGNLVFCRMYTSIKEAIQGFTKNYYPGFNTKPYIFIIIITLLFSIFVSPFVLVFSYWEYVFPVFFILISRYFISLLSNQSVFYNILFHIPQMIFMCLTGIRSLFLNLNNRIVWKERKIL